MTWEIEYFETQRGRCPVQEFIDSLDTRSKAKVARTFDLLEKKSGPIPQQDLRTARHRRAEFLTRRRRS